MYFIYNNCYFLTLLYKRIRHEKIISQKNQSKSNIDFKNELAI